MAKYYYKVDTSIVKDQWGENTEMPFPVEDEIKATLIIEASSEEESLAQRTTISYVPAWELDKVED